MQLFLESTLVLESSLGPEAETFTPQKIMTVIPSERET